MTRKIGTVGWLAVLCAIALSPMPHRCSAGERKPRLTLEGHTKVVTSLAITADGRTLASGSYDATIKLWDLATGKERATLSGHAGGVHSEAVTADGRTLASGSQDDTVKLWDVASGREITTIKHGYHVRSVLFTPDSKVLITGGEGPVKLWDVATGKEQRALKLAMSKNNGNLVLSMALKTDGSLLCSGHGDGTVKLWNMATGDEQTTLRVSDKKSDGHVARVAFAPEGPTLACGMSDGTVRLRDLISGTEQASLKAHPARVWAVAFSPDGRTLASGGWDGVIRLWDVATGEQRDEFKAHDNRVYFVVFTPDGKSLASGGGIQFERGEVKLWDVAAVNPPAQDEKGPSTAVREEIDGPFRFGGTALKIMGPVRVLDAHTLQFEDGTEVELNGGMDAPDLGQKSRIGDSFYPCGVEAAEFLKKLTGDQSVTCRVEGPRGKRLHGTCFVKETCLQIEMVRNGWAISHHSGMEAWEMLAQENKRGLFRGTFVAPERWRLAERLPGELPPNELANRLLEDESPVECVAFDAAGAWLIAGGSDGAVRLWDMKKNYSARCRHVLRGHAEPVRSLAISPNRRWLASGSFDGAVWLWDLAAGEPTTPSAQNLHLPAPDATRERLLCALEMSANNRWLISKAGTQPDETRIWDLQADDPRRTMLTLDASATLATSPNRRWLIGGADRTSRKIQIWDLHEDDPWGKKVAFDAGGNASPDALSPDGRWLFARSRAAADRSQDQYLVWDLKQADPAARVLISHQWPTPPRAGGISPDGRWLAVAFDVTPCGIDLWDLRENDLTARHVVLRGHEKTIREIAFSPNGRWLVSGGDDKTARLWDLNAPDPVATSRLLAGHSSKVETLVVAPNGRWLATSDNHAVRVWNLHAADPAAHSILVREFKGSVNTVLISPDSRWLVIHGADKTLHCWKLESDAAFEE